MHRVITVPETITVEMTAETKPFPFAEFIDALLNHPDWATDWKAIQAAKEVSVLVEVDEGDEVRLHSSAFDKLKKLVETPSAGGYGMHPKALRQVTPYFEAILDAPKAKKTDDE